jgi:hypothetical protein
MQRWICADSGEQRIRQRASRADRSGFTLTWKGDTYKLTDSDEQAERQRNRRLNQTPRGRYCYRSRNECPSCREQDWRNRRMSASPRC